MKLVNILKEIKIGSPINKIKPDEYKIIYDLFQGVKDKIYLNTNMWGIDFDLISKNYFTSSPGNPLFFEPQEYDELAKYLDKTNMLLAFKALPVIEMGNPNIYTEENMGKYPNQQYYILKQNNRFYFVDTQGYDYPRYITYLKNFPL